MIIEAVVEIPKYSTYKYELKNNELVLDRVVSIPYPYNYGFIPDTLEDDGDPADIYIISQDPIVPKTKVKVELIGVFKCLDNGIKDDKFIGILIGDKDSVLELDRIQNFLSKYKNGFQVIQREEKKEAESLLSIVKANYT